MYIYVYIYTYIYIYIGTYGTRPQVLEILPGGRVKVRRLGFRFGFRV